MIKFKITLFFLLITSFIANSQTFTLFDIDASEFPIFKAKFIAIDKNANQVIDIKPDEVTILEGEHNAEVISVINPQPAPPLPLSVVIAIDISSSMSGYQIDIAKKVATTLVDMFSLEISECAIVSFDDKSYLNCDFTKNPNKLMSSINSLNAKGGTSFDAALIGKPSGGFWITQNASYKKVVIIVTDGQSNGNEKEILRIAEENNISLFSVGVSYYLPDVLINVPSKTGGRFYEKVITDADISNACASIVFNTQKLKYSEIIWKSSDYCTPFRTLKLKTRQFFTTSEVIASETKLINFTVTPSSLSFGKVPKNETKELILTLKAPNKAIDISDISINNADYKIKEDLKFPFTLESKVEKKITIVYTAKDTVKKFSQIIIKSSLCKDKTVSLSSGYSENISKTNLFVKSPNGMEIFVAGTDTVITWGGINSSANISLEFSADNGKKWTHIDDSKGLLYKWNVPNFISTKCLVRAKTILPNGGIKLLNLTSINANVNCIAISPNDNTIVAGGSDIFFFNAKTGAFLFMLKSYKGAVLSVDFSNDGKRVAASTSSECAVRIYDVASGVCLASVLKEHFKDVECVRFNPKSDKIVTTSGNSVRIWNASNGKLINKLIGHTDIVKSANFSPDGNKIVTASYDNTLKVWNAISGTLLYTITEKKCKFNEANFSPDGLQIVSACSDTVARVWDVASGTLALILKGHTDEVKSAIYSKDGSKIITISNDNTMKLWDAYTGMLLYTVDAHYQPINSVCISNDGKKIYTSSLDHSLKIWALNTDKNVDEDCSDNTFSIISPKPKAKDVAFGKQLLGTEIDKTISGFITNPNKYKLKINKIEIVGKNAADYRILSSLPPYTIEPNSKKDIEFSFIPVEEGDRNAIILIYTPTDTLKQKISGIGIKKQIEIISANIDFGKVLLNKTVDTSIVLLTNSSNLPVNITKVENAGPDTKQFILLEGNNPFILNPGEKKFFKIRFAPISRGKTNGSILFYIKDIDGYSVVNLLGEGDAPKTLTLYGKIYDSKTKSTLSADVVCYDILSNREMKKLRTDAQGNYSFIIDIDRNYSLIVQKDSFLTASENIDLSTNIINDKIEKDVFLSKIEVGSSVRLNNIFFDFAKATLRPESYPDLDRIVKLMKEYPNIEIEIDGHTDFVGSNADNIILSKNRAKSCLDYIVAKGIKIERLTFKGYGEDKPVADNKTEEGRKLNRRVEFIIIKK